MQLQIMATLDNKPCNWFDLRWIDQFFQDIEKERESHIASIGNIHHLNDTRPPHTRKIPIDQSLHMIITLPSRLCLDVDRYDQILRGTRVGWCGFAIATSSARRECA